LATASLLDENKELKVFENRPYVSLNSLMNEENYIKKSFICLHSSWNHKVQEGPDTEYACRQTREKRSFAGLQTNYQNGPLGSKFLPIVIGFS